MGHDILSFDSKPIGQVAVWSEAVIITPKYKDTPGGPSSFVLKFPPADEKKVQMAAS